MVGLLVVAPLFLVWPMVFAVLGCMGILVLGFFVQESSENHENPIKWVNAGEEVLSEWILNFLTGF